MSGAALTPTPAPNVEEDNKPEFFTHIQLKVKGQDGDEVFFKIKRKAQLKKLMKAYCDRQSVDLNSIVFLFDGRKIRLEQTPYELEMEDADEIDAMLHQTGGSPISLRYFVGYCENYDTSLENFYLGYVPYGFTM